jgi:hypothetical protein
MMGQPGGLITMIDMQLFSDALMTVVVLAVAAVAFTASIMAAAAVAQRHECRAHIRGIERYLAAAAEQRRDTATR